MTTSRLALASSTTQTGLLIVVGSVLCGGFGLRFRFQGQEYREAGVAGPPEINIMETEDKGET